VLSVRWYLSFKLSYRDLVSKMKERGICLAHTTILRWVQHYTPEFVKRWQRYVRSQLTSWMLNTVSGVSLTIWSGPAIPPLPG
jgi:IS6 family transposase